MLSVKGFCRTSVRKYIQDSQPDLRFDYLKRSIIPTLHFQSSLPRLPVPDLEKTCSRYLKSQEALAPNQEVHDATKNFVADFLKDSGPRLQQLLNDYDKRRKNSSYISDIWFSYYLKDRRPLALNTNPFISMKDDKKLTYNHQIVRAANLVMSSLRFLNSYNEKTLEPDIFHMKPQNSDTKLYHYLCRMTPKFMSFYTSYLFNAYPLDMSQYKNLFCSTRIPKLGKDCLKSFPSNLNRPSLLVGVSPGYFYHIKLHDNDGRLLPIHVIYSLLQRVATKEQENMAVDKTPLVNLMTGLGDRNEWAAFRDDLIAHSHTNGEMLNLIDSSLYVLCLDKKSKNVDVNKHKDFDNALSLARQFLFAPQEAITFNRWFDKSFQLIIDSEGKTAVNMEHAWGDGVSVVRFMSDIYYDSVTRPAIDPPSAQLCRVTFESYITPIKFSLNQSMVEKLEAKSRKMQEINDDLQIHGGIYKELGKNVIKRKGLSPDAIIQLAFQVANYKILKRVSSTYESCSTAAFRAGRTETVRPATLESKEFCQALVDKRIRDENLWQLLNKCSIKHSKLTREALMGQGFDRHLFALRHMASKNWPDEPLPKIFTDPEYVHMNQNTLSTSTVDNPMIEMGGFGPVVHNGLGISYGMNPEHVGVFSTSYKSVNSSLNSKSFVDKVMESLEDIKGILNEK